MDDDLSIFVCSFSSLKLQAVSQSNLSHLSPRISPVQSESEISSQPFGLSETLTGARNRVKTGLVSLPQQHQTQSRSVLLAIENGLFEEDDGAFSDRAVVLISVGGFSAFEVSEPVMFPREHVLEAKSRGFESWTVGKVMAEKGLVKNHADPHLDLSGKSRTQFLTETINKLLERPEVKQILKK
jgi:non-canonical (house-cleaning) NTP pyrophosphatase